MKLDLVQTGYIVHAYLQTNSGLRNSRLKKCVCAFKENTIAFTRRVFRCLTAPIKTNEE